MEAHSDLSDLRKLLIRSNGTELPPEIREYVSAAMEDGRDAWPRGLVFDVAVKWCLRELGHTREKEDSPEDARERTATRSRPAAESERVVALRDELSRTTNKKIRLAIEKQLKDLSAL